MRTRTSWRSAATGGALALALIAGLAPAAAQGAASAPDLERATVTGRGPVTAVATGEAEVNAYITRVYNDLFQRDPDPTGLAWWSRALLGGTPYGEVADSITYSDEYRARLINASYSHYLGRAAEGAGIAFWLGSMRSGLHIEQMQAGFIASDEFYARGGGTDAGWVNLLYESVLDRRPAASEVAWWVAQLRAGAGRGEVARGFLYSTEHLTAVVDGYYVDLLDRHIDPSGQRTWVGLIQAGHRDEEIIAAIVSSTEYRGNVVTETGPPTMLLGPIQPDQPGWMSAASISADGRWVTFESWMRVIDGDAGPGPAVYLWDRTTGKTTLVSATPDGTPGDGASGSPSISGDGRWIAYRSDATNLATGNQGILLWERKTGTTTALASVRGTRPSDIGISADGRSVTYVATNPAGRDQVYVTDRATRVTTLVSAAPDGTSGDDWSDTPSISGDGRWITYASASGNLVPGDTDGVLDVFLWDRETATTTLVTSGENGAPSGGSITAISDDGSSIALIGCTPHGTSADCQVLVWDRASGVTAPVSEPRYDKPGDVRLTTPDLSADGRRVTYHAWAPGAAEGNPESRLEVLVTDRDTGSTTVVSRTSRGEAANSLSWAPIISGDGRWVAFQSWATNLVPGMVADPDGGSTERLFVTGPLGE